MSLRGPQSMPPSFYFSGDIKHPGLGGLAQLTNTAWLGGGLQAAPQPSNCSLSKSCWDFKASCLFA